jgi:hypothetical protein
VVHRLSAPRAEAGHRSGTGAQPVEDRQAHPLRRRFPAVGLKRGGGWPRRATRNRRQGGKDASELAYTRSVPDTTRAPPSASENPPSRQEPPKGAGCARAVGRSRHGPPSLLPIGDRRHVDVDRTVPDGELRDAAALERLSHLLGSLVDLERVLVADEVDPGHYARKRVPGARCSYPASRIEAGRGDGYSLLGGKRAMRTGRR